MGRTLRNIMACSMIAGSILFTGCGDKNPLQKAINSIADQATGEQGSYDKALKFAQNPNSIYENTVKENTKPGENFVKEKIKVRGLDFYFFQGDELKFVKPAIRNIEGFDKNPEIIYTKDPKRKRQEWESSESLESLKILSTGSAQYILPQVEEYSETKRLILGFIGFETPQDMNNFLEKKREEFTYPLFVGKELISFIAEPEIDQITNLSEKQKLVYINLIFDYAKRTEMKTRLAKSQSLSDIYSEMFKKYREDQYKLK